jgi:hypothetical protein
VKKPISIVEAERRHLLALEPRTGIHTFSNSDDGLGWYEPNCMSCWFYPPDGPAGESCAMEAALMTGWVTPELAELFGWVQDEKYRDYEPPHRRHGWKPPWPCPFFHERPDKGDDGEDIPPPPDPDPLQLVLITDPTEDIALPHHIPEPREAVRRFGQSPP